MKKMHYLLLASLFCMGIKAQNLPKGENISLDDQLSNVNVSSERTGIIYERTLSVANLYNFNKLKKFNTANYRYFKQVMLEMYRASNEKKFMSVESLKQLSARTTSRNEVDIAILNTEFSILNYKEFDLEQSALLFDKETNKFVQVKDDPFYLLSTTVIAPTKDVVSGTSVTYNIKNDLFFQNGEKRIKTMVAIFGDGIERKLIENNEIINQKVEVAYKESGDKIITFQIVYSDDSTLTTYGKMFFHYSDIPQDIMDTSPSCFAGTDQLKDDNEIEADEAFTGFNPGDQPIRSKIKYRTFYHKIDHTTGSANTEKKITNPIIIIDGFDPGDKRKIEDCDCMDDSDCLARNSPNGVFKPENYSSLVDLMAYYDELGLKKYLLPELRDSGYDVILVNQPTYTASNGTVVDGGADYIERNAMALVKLLTQTASKLTANGSSAKIALMGPSMGGQIARYALAYMEKNNIPNNTFLWVSVDSPHLGANIPLGDQALLNLAKESSDSANDFYQKDLKSPAAQEMLIEQHRESSSYGITGFNFSTGLLTYGWSSNYNQVNNSFLNAQTTSQGMSQNSGNTFYQIYNNNLNSNGLPNSNGWPTSTSTFRKIAIVNGSLTGSKKTLQPNGVQYNDFANDGEKILNIRGFQRVNIDLPWPLGSITFRTHIASLESSNMPTTGNYATIARFKKLFTDRTTQATNINSRGVMDNVPGGYLPAQKEISDPVIGSDPAPGGNPHLTINFNNQVSMENWGLNTFSIENIIKSISNSLGGSYWDLHEFNPIHSFIPTFSSLAILQPNQNWNNPLDSNLICPTNIQTPFDSYYGTAFNTEHVSFTKESVAWLKKELAGNPQAPWFPVQADALQGDNAVCEGKNATYTFADICNVPSPVKYNDQNGNPINGWSVQGALEITNSTPYSVTVKGTSNYSSTGTITATFQNGQTFTKNIQLGAPTFNAIDAINGPSFVHFDQTVTYTFSGTGSGYTWQIFAPSNCAWQILSGQGTSTITVKTGCVTANATIQVSQSNACGTATKDMVTLIRPLNIGGGGNDPNDPDPCGPTLSVYPNPVASNNILNLELLKVTINPCGDPNVRIAKDAIVINQVKIYNFYGVLVYSNNCNNNLLNLDNLNLTTGNYTLNAFTSDGKILREVLFVQ